jgi:hypothetical protein
MASSVKVRLPRLMLLKRISQELFNLLNRVGFHHKDWHTSLFCFYNGLQAITIITALGQQHISICQGFDYNCRDTQTFDGLQQPVSRYSEGKDLLFTFMP